MICSTCLHAIQRTYSNGPQFKYAKHYCDLDGQEIIVQIADCSRLEERVVFTPPTDEQIEKFTDPIIVEGPPEVIPYMQKRGLLEGKPRAKRK